MQFSRDSHVTCLYKMGFAMLQWCQTSCQVLAWPLQRDAGVAEQAATLLTATISCMQQLVLPTCSQPWLVLLGTCGFHALPALNASFRLPSHSLRQNTTHHICSKHGRHGACEEGLIWISKNLCPTVFNQIQHSQRAAASRYWIPMPRTHRTQQQQEPHQCPCLLRQQSPWREISPSACPCLLILAVCP